VSKERVLAAVQTQFACKISGRSADASATALQCQHPLDTGRLGDVVEARDEARQANMLLRAFPIDCVKPTESPGMCPKQATFDDVFKFCDAN